MIEHILGGFLTLADPVVILVAFAGLVAGVVVGALPGLTATMAVAVLAPFTFFMETLIGIPFLLAAYKGAIYAGSIPAVLLNTPGTAAAAATAIDGNVMARQGRAKLALQISLVASVIADLLATFVLILVAAPLASIAIKFGASEFALLYLIALTMIAVVSGEDPLKGLIAAAIGVSVALVGLDPMSGAQRYTLGSVNLLGGISLIPLLIGLFAISELLISVEESVQRKAEKDAITGDDGGPGLTPRRLKSLMPTILRSTGIGTVLGALPGLGAEISCWISYGWAKRFSREPEKFSKGSEEGVAAAEAGNNAVCPSALIPMMVFGIPGDTITAVLLGAFMAQGLLPGPLMFSRDPETIYALFAFLIVSNLMLFGFGLFAIRYLRRIVLIPDGLLYPVVAVLCFAGAYAVNNSSFDILIMMVGGVAGYLMRKTGMAIPPLVIGMLLAPGLEQSLRQTFLLSNGDPSIFVTRPISLLLTIAFAILVAGLVISNTRRVLNNNNRPNQQGVSQ